MEAATAAARVMAPPTAEHTAVAQVLRQVRTGPGTAAGEAVYAALDAIEAAGASGTTAGAQTAPSWCSPTA